MKKILITGSTGYIGSRLIQALKDSPYHLICTARTPEYLEGRLPKNAVARQVDFAKKGDFTSVFEDCEAAFFLIHALGERKGFDRIEKKIAENFAMAAKKAGVKKIIYLGGLIDEDAVKQSSHMQSRRDVGEILRRSGIPVIEFRASVILGPHSTSFELIRALVERLPVMITPRWVSMKIQPIYIDTVIDYLRASIETKVPASIKVEIGGKDVVSCIELMYLYAKERGLRRVIIPVPFLTPYLSSLWLGLITPVYARVGRKLIDGINNPSVVRDPEPAERFNIKTMSCKETIDKCLNTEDLSLSLSRWADALSNSVNQAPRKYFHYGNRIVETYQQVVPPHIKAPFKPIEEIGGRQGWYFLTILWKLRGYIDLLLGGVGLGRGRKHQSQLQVGDTLDWWRVEAYTPGQHLRLKAEMKVPGRAWLDFELTEKAQQRQLSQTVIFDPQGFLGLLYWYLLLPFHFLIFKGMLRQIMKRAV